jgi:Flp pilus assembly protein TadD
MKYLFIISLMFVFVAGCTKMEEKKSNTSGNMNPQENTTQKQMPNNMGNPHEQGMQQKQTEIDPKIAELSKDAFDFEKTYESNKSAGNKKKLIEKHLAAGNSMMPGGDMSHMNKQMFRDALKHFRRVLELEPDNKEAKDGKLQIEDMYNAIGMPIPQ